MNCYRDFADALEKQLKKIEDRAKYQEDTDRALTDLENAYRNIMLEKVVPDVSTVAGCLIRGSYYRTKYGMPVSVVKEFLRVMKSVSPEKRRIIMANLYGRLDAIDRYTEISSDDIPF